MWLCHYACSFTVFCICELFHLCILHQDPEFQPDLVAAKSNAAAGLCSWVLNIVKFYEVYCEVEPKREALSKANAELDAAQEKLAVIKSKINVSHHIGLMIAWLLVFYIYQVSVLKKSEFQHLNCDIHSTKFLLTFYSCKDLLISFLHQQKHWKMSRNSICHL